MTADGRKITCVEFFSAAPVDNICVSLTGKADVIYFLCSNSKSASRAIENYRRVIEGRGLLTDIRIKSVNRNSLDGLVKALTDIALSSDICIFDLTGGDDIPLVAAGVVYDSLKGKKEIQMHRFNVTTAVREKILVNCDSDPETFFEGTGAPELSVAENIRLSGGDVIMSGNDFPFGRKDLTGAAVSDINCLWKIYCANAADWNEMTRQFQQIPEKPLREEDNLLSDGRELAVFSLKTGIPKALLSSLIAKKLLLGLYYSGSYSVSFKNRLVKECLTTAGKLLELKVFERCASAKEKDGSFVYSDVMTGVKIDWTGMVGEPGTTNEIDVIAMRGTISVYISCKNGKFDSNEMYKLSSVADAFGKKYARRAIVATAMSNDQNTPVLRERAKDMKITMIEDFCAQSDARMAKSLASLWQQ